MDYLSIYLFTPHPEFPNITAYAVNCIIQPKVRKKSDQNTVDDGMALMNIVAIFSQIVYILCTLCAVGIYLLVSSTK